jgi:ethanolamine permease
MSQRIAAEGGDTKSAKALIKENINFHPSSWHIWCLGITIVIGGQYFSWNFGLVAGFGSCCISYCIVSCGYLALCCCTSELTSALPFAGGAYGLARCSLGFYCGFMVGCSEALEYITYTAISYVTLVSMMVSAAPGLAGWEPLLWLLFYAVSMIIYILCSRSMFYNVVVFLAVVSTALLLVFCFGSLQYVDFAANATPVFAGGAWGFFNNLQLAAWFYIGVESLNMGANEVADPRSTIPRGQISCMLTLIVTGTLVLFITCSLPPGINEIATDLLPFNRGWLL